jgi:cell growth-regulating nucleolar protein
LDETNERFPFFTAQSCMTEAQKYEGALYKAKPQKGNKQGKKQTDKSKTLTTTNGNSANTKKPRHPYVEDAPDADDPDYKLPPPAPSPPRDSTKAASKPTSKPAKSTELAAPPEPDDVNVFDFLVAEQTPTASKVSLAGSSKEQMAMISNAPSVFEPSKALAQYDTDVEEEDREYDVAYEENGFSYGADPIKPSMYENQVSNISMDFMTPAPKKKEKKSRKKGAGRDSPDPEAKTTSDKKRKRGHVDELNVEAADARPEEDTPMTDAPSSVINHAGTPYLQHSGLTGGLDRMLREERSLSPDYEDYTDDEGDSRRYQDPQSPLKRTRRSDKAAGPGDNGLGISLKGRAGRIMSMFSGSNVSGSSHGSAEPPSKALVRTRPFADDGDHNGALVQVRRSKKTANVRHVRAGESRKTKRKISQQSYGNDHYDSTRPSRRLKAIEYHGGRGSDSPGDDNRKMVVYHHHERLAEEEAEREKAGYFLSLVTKGPESERGCSINKALKRFHRDYPSIAGSLQDHEEDMHERDRRGRGRSSRADRDVRVDEEKDLWRTLRLKRNDRGEVVVFF